MRASARQVGPLERMVHLKSLNGVGDMDGEDLILLAQYAEERYFKKGTVFIPGDRPVSSVHFVVDGSATTYYDGVPIITVEAPDGIGFLGLLAREDGGVEGVAEEDTMTLEIPGDAMFEIMDSNPTFMLAGMRQMSRQLLGARNALPEDMSPLPEPDPATYPTHASHFVERLIGLQSAAFGAATLDAIAGLASRLTEVRYEPGERIWEIGDHAAFGLSLRWGNVRCTNAAGKSAVVGGDYGLGYLDSVGETPRTYDAVSLTRVVALRGDHVDFTDQLTEEPELALNMLA